MEWKSVSELRPKVIWNGMGSISDAGECGEKCGADVSSATNLLVGDRTLNSEKGVATRSKAGQAVTYAYQLDKLTVKAVYELSDKWRFLRPGGVEAAAYALLLP